MLMSIIYEREGGGSDVDDLAWPLFGSFQQACSLDDGSSCI